jgi:hypothetical protein
MVHLFLAMFAITWYAISVLVRCDNVTLKACLFWVCGVFDAQWNSENGVTW